MFILLKYGLHPIDSPSTMCLGYISIYSIRLINHKEEGKNEEPEELVYRSGALFRSPSLACGVHTLDGEFRPAMMNSPHSHFQPLSYRKSLRESLAPFLPSLSGLRLCETAPKYSLYPSKIGYPIERLALTRLKTPLESPCILKGGFFAVAYPMGGKPISLDFQSVLLLI